MRASAPDADVSVADADASAADADATTEDVVETEVAAPDADVTATPEADAGSAGAPPFKSDDFSGYADQAAFARAFRRSAGATPADFRARHLER